MFLTNLFTQNANFKPSFSAFWAVKSILNPEKSKQGSVAQQAASKCYEVADWLPTVAAASPASLQICF